MQALEVLSSPLQHALKEIESQFHVGALKLKEISVRFQDELQDGLHKHGANIVGSAIPCFDPNSE